MNAPTSKTITNKPNKEKSTEKIDGAGMTLAIVFMTKEICWCYNEEMRNQISIISNGAKTNISNNNSPLCGLRANTA